MGNCVMPSKAFRGSTVHYFSRFLTFICVWGGSLAGDRFPEVEKDRVIHRGTGGATGPRVPMGSDFSKL